MWIHEVDGRIEAIRYGTLSVVPDLKLLSAFAKTRQSWHHNNAARSKRPQTRHPSSPSDNIHVEGLASKIDSSFKYHKQHSGPEFLHCYLDIA